MSKSQKERWQLFFYSHRNQEQAPAYLRYRYVNIGSVSIRSWSNIESAVAFVMFPFVMFPEE